MFNYRYCLTPLSIVLQFKTVFTLTTSRDIYYRTIYVFGFRLVYWTVGSLGDRAK